MSEVPEGWLIKPLSDLVNARGITYGVVQPGPFIEDGVPLVRVSDFKSDGIRREALARIDPAIAARYDRSTLSGSEVLVTLVGTVGLVAVTTPELVGCNVARAVGVVPLPDPLTAQWVARNLQGATVRRFFDDRLNTTVQRTLNLRDLAAVRILLPPPEEMGAITQLLRTLDDKIVSNKRTADGGLRLIRAEYQRSFLVGGNASSTVRPLSELAEVVMGQSPPGATYFTDPGTGMPMVQGKGAFGERFVEPKTFTSSPTKIVEAGTLLMTVRAPVGSLNLTTETTCVGRGVAALLTQWPAFVECSLGWMKARWASEAGGTIYPSVNGQQIQDSPVLAVDPEGLNAFEIFAAPFRERALTLHGESERLASIRDALLPRLVSGRIRVPLTEDAAEAVETVLDAA